MISIIIPYVRDRGYLNEARESVSAQTYRNFELIEERWGTQGANINRGVRRAKGEYIKILHDDDILPPRSLEILRQWIGDYDWICGDMEIFGDPAFCDAGIHIGRVPELSRMIGENEIYGGTTLYKRSVLLEVGGYDEKLWTGEEYDLHLRLLKLGYSCTYVNEVVHRYRLHAHNKSYDLGYGEKKERREFIREIANKYR